MLHVILVWSQLLDLDVHHAVSTSRKLSLKPNIAPKKPDSLQLSNTHDPVTSALKGHSTAVMDITTSVAVSMSLVSEIMISVVLLEINVSVVNKGNVESNEVDGIDLVIVWKVVDMDVCDVRMMEVSVGWDWDEIWRSVDSECAVEMGIASSSWRDVVGFACVSEMRVINEVICVDVESWIDCCLSASSLSSSPSLSSSLFSTSSDPELLVSDWEEFSWFSTTEVIVLPILESPFSSGIKSSVGDTAGCAFPSDDHVLIWDNVWDWSTCHNS